MRDAAVELHARHDVVRARQHSRRHGQVSLAAGRTGGEPTTIVAPANVIPVGGPYTIDVDFVQDFSLVDGTVQATLTNDYSKLIRVIPQALTRSSTPGVMVN